MHFHSAGDFLYFWSSIAFNVGIIVSICVTFRRGQVIVRRRVVRRGRPVSGAFLFAQFVWCVAKSLVWPVNLVAWLLLGRPDPGTYRPERQVARGSSPGASAATHGPA